MFLLFASLINYSLTNKVVNANGLGYQKQFLPTSESSLDLQELPVCKNPENLELRTYSMASLGFLIALRIFLSGTVN
jgi:hypothetical protein